MFYTLTEKYPLECVFVYNGLLDFTACQHLGYFMPKTFLLYLFFAMYGYLYITLGDTSVGNWILRIVERVQLLLSGEVNFSFEDWYIKVCVYLLVGEVWVYGFIYLVRGQFFFQEVDHVIRIYCFK